MYLATDLSRGAKIADDLAEIEERHAGYFKRRGYTGPLQTFLLDLPENDFIIVRTEIVLEGPDEETA